MRQLLKLSVAALAMVLVWFGIWSAMMAADVARVKASIDHHYQQLRTTNRSMSLAADSVEASGFPFAFQVAVKHATLSMVDGDETFALSIPELTMTSSDNAQGIYRVTLPSKLEALYAKNGQAPEHYRVTMNIIPKLNLSAADASKPCGPLMGQACEDVASDAPLISFAVGLPSSMILRMQLNDKTRDAHFDLPAIALPVYQPIPKDLRSPLQLFVGVLREALVFNTPGNEVPEGSRES